MYFNKVYIPIYKSYLNRLQEYFGPNKYDSIVENLDFSKPEEARKFINSYMERVTKIKEFLPQGIYYK